MNLAKMKPKELREWLFQNNQEDQWWLCLDSVTEELTLTVSEIEDYIKSGEYITVKALHVSQSEMGNPPWVDVELQPQLPSHSPEMSEPMRPASALAAAQQKPRGALGIVMLSLPIISALLVWFWLESNGGDDNSATRGGSVENMDTMARDFAVNVKVTLDVSTVGDLTRQIPFQAEMSRGNGDDRIFKWRFDDGSAMIAYFRPAPGDKNGLLLDRVDFED